MLMQQGLLSTLTLLSFAAFSSAIEHSQAFFSSSKGFGLGQHVPQSLKKAGYSKGPLHATAYDSSSFEPLEDLKALSSSNFTTFGHPAFPDYNVRIQKSNFCDGSVNSYTGYIDIQARHLFFYFFESRNDPDTDDVIFWTTGGPGCSSSLGLFMELGPCRVTNDHSDPIYNPNAWNTNANVFFIDQPVGTGFSYAEYGETVSTTEEGAKDIAAFVAIFFENFSQFKGRAFHMAGGSYAGRYIPVYASAVYDQNAQLIEAGLTPVNLSSIMIGNGITDYVSMYYGSYEMQCSPASVFPIQSISTCVRMKQALTRCQKWLKVACMDQLDAMNCEAAVNFCDEEIDRPFYKSGKNPYDMSKDCEGDISETLCYTVTNAIERYLGRPDIQKLLGVDPPVMGKFASYSNTVGALFSAALDEYHPTWYYVAGLLERGVRALIYVGDYDWICNWVGNEIWTRNLEWSGQKAFAEYDLREWTANGSGAGLTRSAKGFTFATIYGAGHMAPHDKPKQTLTLVQRWIAGEEL